MRKKSLWLHSHSCHRRSWISTEPCNPIGLSCKLRRRLGFCFHKEVTDDCVATSEAPGQCRIFKFFFFDRVNRRSVKSGSPWLVSFLTPHLGINQYLLTKALPAFSPLSLHSYSYFRMLLESAAKCQDLYKVNISVNVTGRVEGVWGWVGWKYFSPVPKSESCQRLGQEWCLCQRLFHQVVCFCRVLSDHIGVGVCILMSGCRRDWGKI